MTAPRAAFGLLLLVGATMAGTPVPGWAGATEPTHKGRRAAPVHPSHTAPDVTGTIAKPSGVAPSPPASDDVAPPPFKLPAASRERVRACGIVWRDMKLAGKTGDDDWRDFAEKCFVAKEPPIASP